MGSGAQIAWIRFEMSPRVRRRLRCGRLWFEFSFRFLFFFGSVSCGFLLRRGGGAVRMGTRGARSRGGAVVAAAGIHRGSHSASLSMPQDHQV
jgi:hypothetical protein